MITDRIGHHSVLIHVIPLCIRRIATEKSFEVVACVFEIKSTSYHQKHLSHRPEHELDFRSIGIFTEIPTPVFDANQREYIFWLLGKFNFLPACVPVILNYSRTCLTWDICISTVPSPCIRLWSDDWCPGASQFANVRSLGRVVQSQVRITQG